ncbi:NAD-dependent epimerase/dehydratase family protein [Mucilaginibacter sp. X5P1]|uniref:NAD-dependent epimerase/dehydratase family protein n=1 Tax=Mucilaginibacter sp. X5P1 TaxID=2723088 RepID=UPI00160CB67C|nr:NAD-dependent epimerase/dehydratase family protein [Mucilaginibacter sp. X5P1]MBB6141221.1 nucleoside-diphosphate-sugar epimerase [Mucilaginibacter sp. X5P1]
MNEIIKGDLLKIISTDIGWDKLANKTVLITGANGFLPAYMVYTLLFLNQQIPGFNVKVIALVRNRNNANEKFKDYLHDNNLLIIEQDVCDIITLKSDVDYIVHAASQASPKYYGIDPVGTLSANVLGTINLLNFARQKHLTSFLFFSSGEVYGQVDEAFNPVKEDYYGYIDPMKVRACYGESKRMGENICVSYYTQYNININVVRPFHTYGPGMQLNDGRVYADFVADIVNGRDIEMKSDGSASRAFCYLADATIGFFMVLLKGKPGEAYNVGNPDQEYTILELAETLTSISTQDLKVIKAPVNDGVQYLKSPLLRNTPNVDKLLALGWNPETSISTGFKRTIDSYLK